MKIRRTHLLVSLIISPLSLANQVSAQETNLKVSMDAAYEALKSLQPYLATPENFEDPKNKEVITTQLQKLESEFHDIEQLPSKYKAQPGFAANLRILKHGLSDSLNRLREGRTNYTYWRLRGVTNNCTGCHISYNVDLKFYDPSGLPSNIDAFRRGEFYLASRQFDRAEEAFTEAVAKPDLDHASMDALRRWLIIYTRVNPRPAEALKRLPNLVSKGRFSPYDQEQIRDWQHSLQSWVAEKAPEGDLLVRAESLIRTALAGHDALADKYGAVELLRATGLLHKVLQDPA